ncbi:hypothetical protein ILYODFUR_034440 [Ilyodon furcidens]|uniref:Uncharacterized protein n=1 Tax=Ilyodon furcidens TaxID=33524 RepID=A0ABV0TH19_9TELE
MGWPKLIQEREQSMTQPVTKKKKNRHTQSQSPTPTLMHTHKLTRTQRKDKQQWTSYTQSHSPCILHTPRFRRWQPPGETSPRTQEAVPFPPFPNHSLKYYFIKTIFYLILHCEWLSKGMLIIAYVGSKTNLTSLPDSSR